MHRRNILISNAAITGAIIYAQHQKQRPQQPLAPYHRPYHLSQALPQFRIGDSAKFGMGWREDRDDVMLRLLKLQGNPAAPEWAKQQAADSYQAVAEAERLGENRKNTIDVAANVLILLGGVFGAVGGAIVGATAYLAGTVIGVARKNGGYLESTLRKDDGDLFKRGRAHLIDKVAFRELPPDVPMVYYDRHGNCDTVTVSRKQARILRKNPQTLSPKKAEKREKALAELDYFKDIQKDPDFQHTRNYNPKEAIGFYTWENGA